MSKSSQRLFRCRQNAFNPNGLHTFSWSTQEHLQGRKSVERPRILRTTESLHCLYVWFRLVRLRLFPFSYATGRRCPGFLTWYWVLLNSISNGCSASEARQAVGKTLVGMWASWAFCELVHISTPTPCLSIKQRWHHGCVQAAWFLDPGFSAYLSMINAPPPHPLAYTTLGVLYCSD